MRCYAVKFYDNDQWSSYYYCSLIMYKSALTDRDAFGHTTRRTRSHGTYSGNIDSDDLTILDIIIKGILVTSVIVVQYTFKRISWARIHNLNIIAEHRKISVGVGDSPLNIQLWWIISDHYNRIRRWRGTWMGIRGRDYTLINDDSLILSHQ